MPQPDNLILWLALRHVPKLGPVTVRKLFAQHQSITTLWNSLQITDEQRKTFVQLATQEYELLNKHNIQVLSIDQSNYPINLLGLKDITPVLYAMGKLDLQDQRAVAVVGTRHPSPYGKDVTESMVRQLIEQRVTIMSGMARGIDGIAHQTALNSGGRTITVWGSGLDVVYPPEHRHLAQAIAEHGAIISQFPLGTQPDNHTFPERNHLVAGLSQAVLVTEAGTKSGALLTARAAQGYGRPVFAVPGSIFSPTSAGPHRLVQQGANLVVDAAAIVEKLGSEPAAASSVTPDTPVARSSSPPSTALEDKLLTLLQAGPQPTDDIIRHSQLAAGEVLSALAMMEMKGLVKKVGEEYRKV